MTALPVTPESRHQGFTLVELIVIISVLGILAAFFGARFSRSSFQDRANYDETVSAVRYAQKIALASGCAVKVTLGTGFTLNQQTACTSGGYSLPVNQPTNTSQAFTDTSFNITPAATIYFTGQGLVDTAAGGISTTTQFTVSTHTFTVNVPSGFLSTP